MMSIARSAATTLSLFLLRRRQHDSAKLRAYFKRRYNIDVGLYSYGCFDRWRMPGPLTVGRYCSIAKTVRSTNNNHPLDALTMHPVLYERQFGVVDENFAWKGSLAIGDDVWIGHNVVILPGCKTIGRGSVIGAGSIVTKDVAPYTIVAGNPARKLRDRFPPDLIAAIEDTRWWELDVPALRELVKRNREVIYHPTVANLSTLKSLSEPA